MHHKHDRPSIHWECIHHDTASSSKSLNTHIRNYFPDIHYNRNEVVFQGRNTETPPGEHYAPTRLARWTNLCTVVTIEHIATLIITQTGVNIQHSQTITKIVTEVVAALAILGPHIYLSVIKIISPTVMIISLFLPNISNHVEIRLLNPRSRRIHLKRDGNTLCTMSLHLKPLHVPMTGVTQLGDQIFRLRTSGETLISAHHLRTVSYIDHMSNRHSIIGLHRHTNQAPIHHHCTIYIGYQDPHQYHLLTVQLQGGSPLTHIIPLLNSNHQTLKQISCSNSRNYFF